MDITLTLNTCSKPMLKEAQALIECLLAQGVQERLEPVPAAENPISPEAYKALAVEVEKPKRTRRTKAEMEAAKTQSDPTMTAPTSPAGSQEKSEKPNENEQKTNDMDTTLKNTAPMTTGSETAKAISQADIRTALLDLIKKVGPVQAKKVLADLGYPNVGSVPKDKTSEVHAGIQAAGA